MTNKDTQDTSLLLRSLCHGLWSHSNSEDSDSQGLIRMLRCLVCIAESDVSVHEQEGEGRLSFVLYVKNLRCVLQKVTSWRVDRNKGDK